MTALIVIGCILLFFWLIGMLRANVTLAYDGQVTVKIRVLFVSIPITPKKQKKPPNPNKYSPEKYRKMLEKAAKKAEKKQQKSDRKAEKKKKKNTDPDTTLVKVGASKSGAAKGGKKKKKKSVSDILGLVGQVLGALQGLFKSFGKHLRIEAVRMKITVASEDAAKTALLYGAVCQSVAYLVEILSAITNFKAKHREKISVEADFLSEKSTADIHLVFRLRVWHVFAMLFAALFGFIRKKLQSSKG